MRRLCKVIRAARTLWCIVGVCLLALVAFELGLRATFCLKDAWVDQPVQNRGKSWGADLLGEWAKLRTERRSYVEWRRTPFDGTYIKIDSRGIRRTWSDPDASTKGQPFRVFMFGGSTMWGTGARDDWTIPSLIAKCLAAGNVSVEVVNFGETGYVTTQELMTLMLCLQRGDVPDIAVFYDGFNDTFSAFQGQPPGAPQNVAVERVQMNMNLVLGRFTTDFRGMNRLVDALRRRVGSHAAAPEENREPGTIVAAQSESIAGAVQTYEQNLRLIQSLGDAYGFSCHFFWQPVLYTKRYPTDWESRATADAIFRGGTFRDFCVTTYRRITQSEYLAKQGRFHNISSIFDDSKEEYYLDDAHITEEGNGIVAGEILKYLKPEIDQQIAPRPSHSDSEAVRRPANNGQ